jgi:hypothetical protein
MSAPGLFRVKRAFMLEGTVQPAGVEVELIDGEMIAMLLDTRRIEPADAKTARRVAARETLTWEIPRESNPAFTTMLPGFVSMPGRR